MKYIIYILFSILAAFTAQAESQPQAPHTKATLLAETVAIAPGIPLRTGLLLEHDTGWHSYWENPGDSGLATQIEWQLPPGFTAGAIDWPPPQLVNEGELAVYSYSDKVFLPVTVSVPAELKESRYTIKAKASWLACHDICIPESAELELPLAVAAAPKKSDAAEWFAKHDAERAVPLATPYRYIVSGKTLQFEIPLADIGGAEAGKAYFFAREPNTIAHAGAQEAVNIDGKLRVLAPLADAMPAEKLGGILRIESEGSTRHFDISLTGEPALATVDAAATPQSYSFFAIIIFALLGGLILNLMPCVLPVLSLKALAVAKKSGKERHETIAHGVAYTAGILLSFALIAALLLGLKNAGEAVGWGYQMQSPAFVGFLIYLLFLVGLNLSGYFDLPVLFGNTGGALASEHSARGSFFTGVLATLVATPCTAPFMASAVGAALALPGWQAMLVFLALGFGLALPFLLISIFPACLKLLPKPGAWMETFKQFMAFPMYASVIWLLWVLTMQTGADGMFVVVIGMLALVVTIWMRRLFQSQLIYRVTAVIFYAVIALWSLPLLSTLVKPAGDHSSLQPEGTVAYSQQGLEQLRRDGKAVFVDATAAWCITCQLNWRVINSEPVRALMKEKNITLMIADWTLRDEHISAWLSSFGYEGVPLYVYYPPSGEPVVLPQLLTEDIIYHTLNPAP